MLVSTILRSSGLKSNGSQYELSVRDFMLALPTRLAAHRTVINLSVPSRKTCLLTYRDKRLLE